MGVPMLSKKLGCVFALAVLPAIAQVPSGSASPQTDLVVVPRHHAPRRAYLGTSPRVIENVTVSDSTNWSGYAVTGSSFTSGKGSWIIPTVNCSKTPNTYSSFWVGIDGWTSSTVEQTGTDSDCNGSSPS